MVFEIKTIYEFQMLGMDCELEVRENFEAIMYRTYYDENDELKYEFLKKFYFLNKNNLENFLKAVEVLQKTEYKNDPGNLNYVYTSSGLKEPVMINCNGF